MSITMSKLSVPVFVRGLKTLSKLLSKGEEHAVQAGISPDILLGSRLAADMLTLSAQIQRACDTSKFAVQRLSGISGPAFADDETTFSQLQERIDNTIIYLTSADAALIDAGAQKDIELGWLNHVFTGESYLLTFALPNFYFHVVTAYDIMRNQGVPLGKLDYLGQFDQQ